MAKVTEKQLKARVTELNLTSLKATTFGLRVDRTAKGYSCYLLYRDSTSPEVLLEEGSASEASACVEAVATTQKVFSQSMLGSTAKPEYVTAEMFIKQGGARCPKTKCGSRDVLPGWVEKSVDCVNQACRCLKCGLDYVIKYRIEDYEVVAKSVGTDTDK
jgi:Zn ribbon nucleic-acid-binding protein